jgi:uncharacterized phage protein gp47/JayE
MPLRTLLISTLERNGTERLQELEPRLDASVYGSHINNLLRSEAYGIYPVYFLAEDILKDTFPQTAEGEALDKNFGVMEDLPRKPASHSIGMICVYGAIGETVPFQTEFDANGITIQTVEAATITQRNVSISSASAIYGMATLITASKHLLPVGGAVSVNVGDADFDGSFEIVGVTDFTITYLIDNENSLTAGMGTASATVAHANAQSLDYGISQNVIGSIELRGDFKAFTLVDGLTGGADAELDPNFSGRIIKKRSLIEGVFTKEQVEEAALRIAGNTRAWCVTPQEGVFGGTPEVAGYKPQPGETCVYVMRDGDINPIASQTVLDLTRNAIVEYGQMPCHTIIDDIHVYAPNLVDCTFQIANLNPDTPAMRKAVEESLRAYMEDILDFEDDFTDKQQISTISNASSGGRKVVDFDLINGDFIAGSGGLLKFVGVSWM